MVEQSWVEKDMHVTKAYVDKQYDALARIFSCDSSLKDSAL